MWVRESEDKTLRIAGYLIKSAPRATCGSPMRSETLALLPRHRDGVTEMTIGGTGELVYTASMDGMVKA